jgi:hypothetical protein
MTVAQITEHNIKLQSENDKILTAAAYLLHNRKSITWEWDNEQSRYSYFIHGKPYGPDGSSLRETLRAYARTR